MEQVLKFDNEKYEYCVSIYGPMFSDAAVVGEGLIPGKHYFDRYAKLWYFLAELKITEHRLKSPKLQYEIREGKAVRWCTNVEVHYIYDFVVYTAPYKFDWLRDHQLVKQFFTDQWGGIICDCTRSSLIRTVLPEFPVLACGHTIELLNLKIEDKRHEK